ncbi:MAG: chain length determinant protein EpsF [Rhizobacter sp.]|nr:chain length determinant protein EpsF [Rhizobacter sp.]
MSIVQLLRIILARKWIVLTIFLVVASLGLTIVLRMPKQYVANASLVIDVRPDPLMGPFVSPANIATQVEVIKSDKVATRVVKMLGLDSAPDTISKWRESTQGRVPLDRHLADLLQLGLSAEPLHGSNVINLSFAAPDPSFAAAAANAFAQAAIDVSIEMRVEPARQSATWFEGQAKALRANLEQAQARLSKFQQEKGIVVSDERMDLENTRLTTLTAQLAAAQAESVDAAGRQRNTGSETSPDVQQSMAVQSLKAQLSTAETKLAEISSIVGSNHPQRLQLEAQIAGLKQQLAAEVRRVSGGTSVVSRASTQKVNELRAMVEAQKKHILSLRSEKDQVAVLARDVETAQRAYDSVSQRMGQLNMESQTNQSMLRLLSQAVQPSEPSKKKLVVGIIGSLLGGLLLGAAAVVAWELLDRRVRGVEDMLVLPGVPVIGVLHTADSKRPIFRGLTGPKGPVPPSLSGPAPGAS